MSDEEHEFEMLLPFVVCDDQGGPYDALAYTAGWEMGALDARLAAAVHHGLGCPQVVIRRDNVPQAELVAMQHGMTVTEQHMELTESDDPDKVRDEWASLVFAWGTPLP